MELCNTRMYVRVCMCVLLWRILQFDAFLWISYEISLKKFFQLKVWCFSCPFIDEKVKNLNEIYRNKRNKQNKHSHFYYRPETIVHFPLFHLTHKRIMKQETDKPNINLDFHQISTCFYTNLHHPCTHKGLNISYIPDFPYFFPRYILIFLKNITK